MLQRCTNPNVKNYKDYGGRGISVCARWRTFANFLADMGTKPSPKHSIDREDNDGNYEPENCRWASRRQQELNKRQRSSKSGVVGVYPRDGKWYAYFKANGKRIHVGTFDRIDAAIVARAEAVARFEEQQVAP